MLQDNDLKVENLLPLSHVSYHVLLSLADQELHGYGIIKEVSQRTRGAIELETGTLYAAIKRMRDDGILAVSARRPVAGEDSRRRYYELTPFGKTLLHAESLRLAHLVSIAQAKRVIV